MALAPEEVGKRIRKARIAKRWTHEEFARRAGVNLRTVQRWQTGRNPKNGKSSLPRLATLMDLAELFDVPRSYFIEDEDPETTLREIRERLGDVEEELSALRRELRDADPGQATARASKPEERP